MLFNNCKRRPHADLFGPTAFYDLDTTGEQADPNTHLTRRPTSST
jgi:hypothetical protein